MFKALSLAAALAVLPLASPAFAQDVQADPSETTSPAEAAIETAAERFEARMDAFGERAEAISEDESLTDQQKETRIAALWGEYAPDVQAFTAVVSQNASLIGGEALAGIDIEALVADALAEADIPAVVTQALAEVNVSGAMAAANGIASNGAWASNDPEHAATMGLMADYAVGEAMDEVDAASDEIQEAVDAAAQASEDAVEAAKPQAQPSND